MHQSIFRPLIRAGVVTLLPGCQSTSGDIAPQQTSGQSKQASPSASTDTPHPMPVSFNEFMARRMLPAPGSGFVSLDVFADDATPKSKILAQCDALRRAYRLPVLTEMYKGRMQVGP